MSFWRGPACRRSSTEGMREGECREALGILAVAHHCGTAAKRVIDGLLRRRRVLYKRTLRIW